MQRPTVQQIKARLERLKTDLFRYMDNGDSNHPSGAAHFYYKFNAKWGVKFLRPSRYGRTGSESRTRLEACRLRQEVAADEGLAPPVGDLVEVTVCDVEYIGFITAHVYTTDNWAARSDWRSSPESVSADVREFFAAHDRGEVRLKEALTALFGVEMYDGKYANCGMFEGTLVCIDFGREGFCSPSRSKYFPDC